jgi:hypothetical protein
MFTKQSETMRVFFGGAILLALVLMWVLASDWSLEQRAIQTPFMSQLKSQAEEIPEYDLRVFANLAISEVGLLPLIGTVTDPNSRSYRQLALVFAQLLPSNESKHGMLASLTNLNFEHLSCKNLECRAKFWSINGKGNNNNNNNDSYKLLSEALKTQVLSKDTSDSCREIEALATLSREMRSSKYDDAVSIMINWIKNAEKCRAWIEPTLRSKVKIETAMRNTIKVGLQQLLNPRNSVDELSVLERKGMLAAGLNPKIDKLIKAVYERDTLCYAAKALSLEYFRHSTSPVLVRNQNDAAAVLAAGVGLASCKFVSSTLGIKYRWPLLVSEIEVKKVSKADLNKAEHTFKSLGLEALPAKCDQSQLSNCIAGIGARSCGNLQLLTDRKTSALVFAQVAPPKIIARANRGKVKYVDNNKNLFNDRVTALNCTGKKHLNTHGNILVRVELDGDANKLAWLNQKSNWVDWGASEKLK